MITGFLCLCAFALVATVIVSVILEQRKKIAAEAGASAPVTQSPVFIDSTGQQFDITPAAPCPTNHGCKFVAAPAEKCLLTEAEKAVATLGEFAPRAKKIARRVRTELQASFDFTAPDAPEAVA